ncbi:hypothetical protein QBC47DRAFT_413001 [Echria macrotheca]|uniref:RNase H type-1 domain-containing protein n=1 Tax=Echria macrotheca TaxID=438768 RepID=A0AAJ0F650_9PEZI|nr:hypothetical protein QBC47DRAFT_413001 [Echria macrotheca]
MKSSARKTKDQESQNTVNFNPMYHAPPLIYKMTRSLTTSRSVSTIHFDYSSPPRMPEPSEAPPIPKTSPDHQPGLWRRDETTFPPIWETTVTGEIYTFRWDDVSHLDQAVHPAGSQEFRGRVLYHESTQLASRRTRAKLALPVWVGSVARSSPTLATPSSPPSSKRDLSKKAKGGGGGGSSWAVYFGPNSVYNKTGILLSTDEITAAEISLKVEIESVHQAVEAIRDLRLRDFLGEYGHVYLFCSSDVLLKALTVWMPRWIGAGGRDSRGEQIVCFEELKRVYNALMELAGWMNVLLIKVQRGYVVPAEGLAERVLDVEEDKEEEEQGDVEDVLKLGCDILALGGSIMGSDSGVGEVAREQYQTVLTSFQKLRKGARAGLLSSPSTPDRR